MFLLLVELVLVVEVEYIFGLVLVVVVVVEGHIFELVLVVSTHFVVLAAKKITKFNIFRLKCIFSTNKSDSELPAA